MTRQEIVDRVESIAQVVFSQPMLKIENEMGPATMPNWTSLTFTQFLTELENAFGFKFKMIEILKLKNMGAIIEAVINHLS